MMSTIRILIADDHPMMLQGIRDVLGTVPHFEIVAACPDGAQALKAIRELKPDVAILDMSMPALGGLQVQTAVQSENLGTRIVFLTALVGTREIITAMAEGAYGLLLKDAAPDALLNCLRDVASGKKHLPFELLERGHDRQDPMRRIPIQQLLTQREWKVMVLAAEGRSNKEIARALKMTEGTAKVHLHHIFRKTGVNNRTALANIAFDHSDRQRSN